jgi:hypothetical protein
MFHVFQISLGIFLHVTGPHLNSPISQKLISRGGTPLVMQNRWSCTCNRAGPVAIFALGGADVICIRNCWSVGQDCLWLVLFASGVTTEVIIMTYCIQLLGFIKQHFLKTSIFCFNRTIIVPEWQIFKTMLISEIQNSCISLIYFWMAG